VANRGHVDGKEGVMRNRMPQDQIGLLRAVPLFAKLNQRDLETIDRLVDEIEVPEGEVLTRQGAKEAQQSFVIIAGEASVEVEGRTVGTLRPGALFGEMAMIDGRPRSATVVATSPMRLLIIGPAAFPTFIAHPSIAPTVLKTMVERLREVEARTLAATEQSQEGAA
jgi:CRP/FNR family cyclic AMP-dependent transcriptional regulator